MKSVVENFREKYRAKDAQKYYSKFDVAVLVTTGRLKFITSTSLERHDGRFFRILEMG